MARDRSLVRASDIGAYTYCRRAWYLAQVRGVAHEQPQRLARGSQAHAQHGRRVQRAARRIVCVGAVGAPSWIAPRLPPTLPQARSLWEGEDGNGIERQGS